MQKLLLGSYSRSGGFLNKAKKLHVSSTCQRAVFLVETKQTEDEHALTMIRNIFSARTHDFITSVDDKGIIIVRELVSTGPMQIWASPAPMLVDMLGSERV